MINNERAKRFAVSIFIVAIAAGLQWLLWPYINAAPFILFYPATILATLYGEGVIAIVLSALIAQYVFVPPEFEFYVEWPGDVTRLTIFLISAFMIRQITKNLTFAIETANEERKKTREAELWLSTTLSSIGDGVIATDREGRVSFMNPVAEELTEWSSTSAHGKTLREIFQLIDDRSGQAIESSVSKVSKSGVIESSIGRTRLIGRNGKETMIEDKAAPICIPGFRNSQGVVLVFRDVSAKYAQEMRLAEAFEQIKNNETRVRNILENALDAVVGMNDQGLVTHWNPQAEKVFGFSEHEVLGKRMSDLIVPKQHREAHERGMRHYLATGQGQVLNRRIEITAIRRDGTEFPIELSVTPIKMSGQTSFAAFIRDISSEQKLKRELLMKSDAIENSLNGFDIVDEQGRIVYANQAYLKMWGYDSLEEVLGTSPVFHCADPETPQKIIQMLKEKGECDIEFVARRKDGSDFDVRMWALLAHDSEGREVYPSSSVDITERKIAERELKFSKEAAEKASHAKTQFLANMSHEIRTPLGVIQGFADLLNEHPTLPNDQQRWVQTIRRNTRQLTNVIGEILDLSKVEADMLEIENMTFSLKEVLDDIAASMHFGAEAKGIGLDISVEKDVPSKITSDPTRFRQILTNLIGNAIKFTEQGKVSVSISRNREGGDSKFLRIVVTDTGIGMTAEHQKNIFEPFVQGDSSMTRRFGGTGLGLAISKRLVKAMDGELVLLESVPGKGTAFEVTLCCIFDEDTQAIATESKDRRSQPRRLEGKKILLVEDSVDNQFLIKRFLADSGAEVVTADNGREGFDKATVEPFDLILLDIQMPEMDGYDTLAAIRSKALHMPIFALTAHALREEQERATKAGFNDYLTKPITKATLIQKIEAVLAPS